MKATIYFKDKEHGFATINADKVLLDDVGAGMALIAYSGEELKGYFSLDSVMSMHLNGD